MLQALPAVLREFPNLVYIVLGATHPNLLREQGESYRISLKRLAHRLGVHKKVLFYNRFVELSELKEFLGAADIYVTPYLNPAQITSGTLAYAFGCGKAVISTPYWHAEELLAEGRGVLVPFRDSAALASEIIGLLRDEPRRHAMRKKAYLMGRDMIWTQVAHQYMASFSHARRSRSDVSSRPVVLRSLDEPQAELPDWRAGPPAAHERQHRPVSARLLHHSQLRRGLLHRRQRPGVAVHRPPRRAGRRLAPVAAAGFHLCRLRQRRLRPQAPPIPQLPRLRPLLAGRGRLRRLFRPVPVGPGRVHRPLAAADSPALGGANLRARPARHHGNHLTAGLGLQSAGHPRILPPPVGRSIGGPGARHPADPPDRSIPADRYSRLALVRAHPDLRQRPCCRKL